MSVPKSRREKHDFLAYHKLIEIRRIVTDLALYGFGYDKDRMERKIERFENGVTNFERKEEIVSRMRLKNESFYEDFVREETEETRKILRKAVFEFELGNSIFPSGTALIMEYCERRKHFDNTIGWLNCLKQELQYIAETLPCDKNRYVSLVDVIDEEISLVKGVRQAANKYLKKQGSL